MGKHVTWGRTGSQIGPSHRHWPDTYPMPDHIEPAHAASEIEDDDDDRKGHMLATAVVAGIATIGLAMVIWGLWGLLP